MRVTGGHKHGHYTVVELCAPFSLAIVVIAWSFWKFRSALQELDHSCDMDEEGPVSIRDAEERSEALALTTSLEQVVALLWWHSWELGRACCASVYPVMRYRGGSLG